MGRKGKFLLIVKALNGAEISTNNGNLGGGVHPFSQKWLSQHGDAFFWYPRPVLVSLLTIKKSLIFEVIHIIIDMGWIPCSIHSQINSGIKCSPSAASSLVNKSTFTEKQQEVEACFHNFVHTLKLRTETVKTIITITVSADECTHPTHFQFPPLFLITNQFSFFFLFFCNGHNFRTPQTSTVIIKEEEEEEVNPRFENQKMHATEWNHAVAERRDISTKEEGLFRIRQFIWDLQIHSFSHSKIAPSSLCFHMENCLQMKRCVCRWRDVKGGQRLPLTKTRKECASPGSIWKRNGRSALVKRHGRDSPGRIPDDDSSTD